MSLKKKSFFKNKKEIVVPLPPINIPHKGKKSPLSIQKTTPWKKGKKERKTQPQPLKAIKFTPLPCHPRNNPLKRSSPTQKKIILIE
jgi:hypothetical protein